MRLTRDQLHAELLRLPPETRAELAELLIQSLERSDDIEDQALAREARERLAGRAEPTLRNLPINDVLGVGAGWSAGWAIVGIVLALLLKGLRPGDFAAGETMGQVVGVLALVGFAAGLAFVGALALLEGRRKLRELRLPRAALVGLLGAGIMPFLSGADPSMGILTGLLGAGFATASVAFLRRPTEGDR
jgi:hypothetical protein